MTITFVFSAVIIKGRKTSESRCVFSGDAAEFRHADDERERGSLADARHACDEIEAAGEIIVSAQVSGDAGKFCCAAFFQTGDICVSQASQPRLIDMFETDFDAGDILLDLLDEGEVLRQIIEAFVGLACVLIQGCRTGSDCSGIYFVILGAAQMHAGAGFDLDGLEHDDSEAVLPQMCNGAVFVSAGCLDANARDAGFGEDSCELLPALESVLHLPALTGAGNGNVKFSFRCIYSSRRGCCGRVVHLRRPCLVSEPKVPATIRV